jgi:hypothetical protein
VRETQEQQKEAATISATAACASGAKQPTVAQSFEKCKVWDINDTRAVRINRLIAEFIATDDVPFQLANNEAFARVLHALEPLYPFPSDKYFRTSLIPEIYESLVTKVFGSISVENGVNFVSFTTDAWPTPQCTIPS